MKTMVHRVGWVLALTFVPLTSHAERCASGVSAHHPGVPRPIVSQVLPMAAFPTHQRVAASRTAFILGQALTTAGVWHSGAYPIDLPQTTGGKLLQRQIPAGAVPIDLVNHSLEGQVSLASMTDHSEYRRFQTQVYIARPLWV